MKKKHLTYFTTLLVLFVGLNGYAQKQFVVDPDAVVREISGSFTRLSLSSGIHVFLSQAESDVLAVSASDDKHREGIKTEITDGVLHIFYKGDRVRYGGNLKMNVYVGYKKLEQLQASGASNILIADILEQPVLNIQLSGASELKGQVKVTDLNIKLSGASEAKINGTVKNINIESSGASDVEAYGLIAENCNVKASGASDVNITVTNAMVANASGASNVYYKGAAQLKLKQSSGASTVARVQ